MEEVVVYCGWSAQQLRFTSDQNNNKLKKDLSAMYSFSPTIHWVLTLLIGFHNYISTIGKEALNEALKTLHLKNKA